MPPPVVMPPMPTEPVSPKPTATPFSAAALVSSPAVRPVCAQTVPASRSKSAAFMSCRSSTMPPSVTLWPAPEWPPLRTASSSPLSLAVAMTCTTSSVSATRTIAAGWRSMPPIETVRAWS